MAGGDRQAAGLRRFPGETADSRSASLSSNQKSDQCATMIRLTVHQRHEEFG
jgi:hypothetical protein